MSRKNKIIISIVGICIISLALIGLTYGYYLTRINGNTNDKSISLSTSKLELTYSDNNDVITGTNIMPGTTLSTKTFKVTNTGTNNVNSYSVGLVNLVNTLTRKDDLKYKVTCTSSVTNKTCNGIEEGTTFPSENTYIIENQIDAKEVQTYIIEVEYKEMNIDQSIDMGSKIEAKLDIFGTNALTIKGTVTNSNENDYVVINSKEQTSEIVDGNYKFIGIEPDTHKITIKNRNNSETKQTTLNVSKGEPSASGSNITYNDKKNIADADIKITDSTVTIDATKISNGDLIPPDDAIIVLNEEFPKISSTLKATITQNDKDSDIDLSNSKWLINKESVNLKDKTGYTWNTFTSNPEVINISKKEPGVYYLHIISSDSNSNIKETIKLISILPEYDTTKNNATITEVGDIWTEGKGTSDNPYLISTKENLEYLSYKVNSGTKYTNTYFALKNDIELDTGIMLEKPIGYNPNKYFNGIFDGKSHKLAGISSDSSCISSSTNFSGLFGVTGPNSEIKNLTISNSTIQGNYYTGFIGYNMGKVSNITLQNDIIRSKYYSGGIAGYNNNILTNVKLLNSSIYGSYYMGGIAGMNIGNITGNNEIQYTVLNLTSSYGGIVAGYNKGTIDGFIIDGVNATGFTADLNGLTGGNEGTITSNNKIK